MQTVSTSFAANATSPIRKLAWRVDISFDKTFNASTEFFTIGSSAIGGTDVLKAADSDIVQEWDKYEYTDYTDRVISFEWAHEEQPYNSVTLSYGMLTLDNTDDFFTQGSGSAVDGDVKPMRPVRLYVGFDNEVIPCFVGLTEDSGSVDEASKTVTFKLVGFLQTLFNRYLEEETLLQNKRTDEVLEQVFQSAGLLAGQYQFDSGYNLIKFVVLQKRARLGDTVMKLIEAEMGRLYIDELGVLTFKNRQSYNDTVRQEFSKHNIFILKRQDDDDIKNVIELRGEVREVQEDQDVGTLAQPLRVPAGGTADAWIEFLDPVTSIETPTRPADAENSFFRVYPNEDGTGTENTTDVTLSSSSLFTKSYKMTFSNAAAVPLFVTQVRLFGTPARVIDNILVKQVDQASVDDYDERPLVIENEYFQDQDQTNSKAIILLRDYAQYVPIERMEVVANPALQIGDTVRVHNESITRDYVITKIQGILSHNRLRQILDVKQYIRETYFTIGSSEIGGTDKLAP